jgi:hypothetical protein
MALSLRERVRSCHLLSTPLSELRVKRDTYLASGRSWLSRQTRVSHSRLTSNDVVFLANNAAGIPFVIGIWASYICFGALLV